jgi:hypothetical protein
MTTERTMTFLASGLLWLVGDVSGRTDLCFAKTSYICKMNDLAQN